MMPEADTLRSLPAAPEEQRATELRRAKGRNRGWRARLQILGRNRIALTIAGIAVGIALWEISALLVGEPVFVPSPADTAATWWHYMIQPFPTLGVPLWEHAAASLGRILAGFFAGTVVGILCAALMISFRPIRGMVDPLIELSRPIPPIAFIPVLIVWFGIGEAPKIVLIMIGVIPVVIVSTVAAIDKVPAEMINAARSLGASDRYVVFHVRIRAALPHIITGLRIAMGISWGSIVASEMIAAVSGLGYVVLQAGVYLRTNLIFAGIVTIAIIGIALDAALRAIQRKLDPSGQNH
jgi:NitT/TauT family transport system permease protein/taurine transport system permease protein